MTINGETLQAMNPDDACKFLAYSGTGNGDMRATKEVVRQKIIAARDLIKCHPLTPELETKLFISQRCGSLRFSAARIEWSEGDLKDVKRLCFQRLALATVNSKCSLYFPKTHTGKGSILPMAVLTQELKLHAERCVRHEDVSKRFMLEGLNAP